MYTFYLYVPRIKRPGRSRSSPSLLYPYTYTLYLYVLRIHSSYSFPSTPLLYPFPLLLFSIPLMYTLYVYNIFIRSTSTFFEQGLPAPRVAIGMEKEGNPLGFTLSIYILYIIFLLTYLM